MYLLVGFLAADYGSPNWFIKHFIPHSSFDLHPLGGICYTEFCHYPCTPRSLIPDDLYSEPYMPTLHEETPIVSLFMSRSIPFCTISPTTSVCPSLKDRTYGPSSPRANMQGLTLSLALTRATKLCFSHAGPLMESFLNKKLKLLVLEAS